MNRFLMLCLVANVQFLLAQSTSISFELNGRSSNKTIIDAPLESTKNPFVKFIGEWTLKDNKWTQNWGAQTEMIKIAQHHTISSQLNTENSLLSIIDGPEPNGHIFWSYNPVTQEVGHLSSFGTSRAGTGRGTVDKNGNLALKIAFADEPKGTYRKYSYTWATADEYVLKSVQFDSLHQPTGLFYGGTFVRIKSSSEEQTKQQILQILSVLDDNEASMASKLAVYTDDLVHMAPDNVEIADKAALKAYLQEQATYGYSDMEHQIADVQSTDNLVIMRGRVVGLFHPSNGEKAIPFQTKNLFVFKRVGDHLQISKVIYNPSPVEEWRQLARKLQKINRQIVAAELANDASKRMTFYTENPILMPDQQPTLQGKENLSAYHQQIGERFQTRQFSKQIKEVIPLKNRVIEIGTFKRTGIYEPSEKPFSHEGKYFNVWTIDKNQALKLAVESWNYDQYIEDKKPLVIDLPNAATNGIFPVQKPLTGQQQSDLKNIIVLMEKGVRERDGRLRAELYPEDGIFMPHGEPMMEGKAKILEHFIDYNSGNVIIDDVRVETNWAEDLDEFILESYRYHVDWRLDALRGTGKGKGLRLWKRMADGSLKIYRIIALEDYE